MARLYPLSLTLVVALAAPAIAQTLQRLTVTQLTLSSSTSAPRVEVPFDLIVTAHTGERLNRLENVDLPVLTDVELLGDESSTVSGASGSTYTERIRVIAHHSGRITIAPVTLDAIDARNGKPTRFSSNALVLNVSGAGLSGAATPAFDMFGFISALVRWFIAFSLVAFVVAVIYVRRRRSLPAPAPVSPPQSVTTPVIERNPLREAYDVVRSAPTRENIVRARAIVREMVGASEAETLDDVLQRIAPHDIRMRSLLRALERASFTHDGDFRPAADDVVRRLEEMT